MKQNLNVVVDLQVPDIQGASLASAIRVKAVKKLITY
jgi:hypothetical protein